MSFRIILKQRNNRPFRVQSFGIILFRMISKLFLDEIPEHSPFGIMLFRMIPKLPFVRNTSKPSFGTMSFRMIPKPHFNMIFE